MPDGATQRILADIAIDKVDASGIAARERPDLYPAPDLSHARDPRRDFSENVAEAAFGSVGASVALGAYWGGVIAGLCSGQFAGARIGGLGTVPHGQLRPLLSALRQAAPDAVLIVETNGLNWGEIAGLAGLGLDAVQCSLPWWNGRAAWLDQELATLSPVAGVLAPFDRGPAHSAVSGIGIAASRGIGSVVPAQDAAAVSAAEHVAAVARQFDALSCSRVLSPPGADILAVLRSDGDARFASTATLLLLNVTNDAASFDPASVLPAVGGAFSPFAAVAVDGHPAPQHSKLVPGQIITIPAGTMLAFSATRATGGTPLPIDPESATRAGGWARLALEDPSPAVDGGAFAVKRIAGETVDVEIDVIGDGHDVLSAALQWQGPGDAEWRETRMRPVANDRWTASFPLEIRGLHRYRVQAWRDAWATFRHELGAKHKAGVPIALELREGTELVRKASARGHGALDPLLRAIDGADADTVRETLMSDETLALMQAADNRPHGVHSAEIPVDAERSGAGFASWYEVFPRSMADDSSRHGTFADVEKHLPRVQAMGFDVLYFPPIHPIGRTNRKGPNNTLTPEPHDVGSPYAVGSEAGGHDAIHPELGTLEDFLHLREAAEAHGLELALDFAIQCSPDHPWLRDHKDWFEWRPDGSIRYAENPPKKYQDIVNVDFYAEGSVPGLWLALANVVLFWCEQGIRLFRVDNPHTKPFPFWQWMIAEVRARYPDAVFLAEAFTRPKVMNRLAKVGFGQSYTYFTWRNSKAELTEYLTQLTEEAPKEFFRPHFFVNTPDINPFFLQNGDRASFLIRAAAAATLSGLWGVYNGFELCEGTRLAPGKEEYLDSEKFQIRHWDWNRPCNIVGEITRLNAIRNTSPALRSHRGVSFLPAANDAVLFFEKATRNRGDVLLVAISMDPYNEQTATIDLPLWKWGLPDQAALRIDDLVTDESFVLYGRTQQLTLSPQSPYRIWRASPAR
ncbi:alpha-1,4-glucan--maltose-1-phosphate maltosyltransferase [Acetobacteraceae bacterium KSS8]|uniref:Alpha-1,4-glucan:maltose-1-phosphate maltosyltransferase n=1 Tax=Endosaccharibacter trunci TaxID=2812733 RepID=A0ABT1W4U4_9PROT|nr:alpha-1,4-glucan--maltose-1-phosphate maltosyltransferase [Acetobacteraceae bacterium KSS8]